MDYLKEIWAEPKLVPRYVNITKRLEIFKTNPKNREIDLGVVDKIEADIRKNGFRDNPIKVDKNWVLQDGHHRLMAAQRADSVVKYMLVGDNEDLRSFNAVGKSWTVRQHMEYNAKLGIGAYMALLEFCEKNSDFSFDICRIMCSIGENEVFGKQTSNSKTIKDIFINGDWVGGDFTLAQEYADNIRRLKPIYHNYNKRTFAGTMIQMLNRDNFSFEEFMHKASIQPLAFRDCANAEQCKTMVENIYNHRRRDRVNLRY